MTVEECLQKFDAVFTRLKLNRERVPLEVLETRYAKGYAALRREVWHWGDWYITAYFNALRRPFHPADEEGNRRVHEQAAAILREEYGPGGLIEQSRAALLDRLDRDEFELLIWRIYDRAEREAYLPYWRSHCRRTGPDGRFFSDIIQKLWWPKEEEGPGFLTGFWGDENRKYDRLWTYPPVESPDVRSGGE